MRSTLKRHLASLFATDIPQVPFPRAQLAHLHPSRQKRAGLPREFSWHDYLVYLLHIAAEIEHALMVEYLYAAYSLGGPDVHADRQTEVLSWQRSILGIAKEEMGHLLSVQNVLRLIGGALNLDREDYPWDIPFYPYPFALEPLSRSSLAKYIFAESPDSWPPDLTGEERQEIENVVKMSPSQAPHRVGQLYELMTDIVSDREALPDSIFREETVPFQASWDEWGRGYQGDTGGTHSDKPRPNVIVQRVASRSETIAVLNLIARQGEWPEADPKAQELSHFRRFLKVFRAFPKPNDKWSPTWAVPTNPQAPGFANPNSGPIVEHPEASLWSLIFNIRYRMLLTYLAHSFRLSAEPMETGANNPRSMVIAHTFTEMYNLRSTAGILVRLPLKDEGHPQRAGPPFQMPYSLALPPEEADCWRLHIDLINAADRLLSQLAEIAKGPRAEYAVVLRSADHRAKQEIELLLGSSRRGDIQRTTRRMIAL
jgi:hypothetical protein